MIVSQSPDPVDVFDILRDRAFQWDAIGRELRVPYGYREELGIEGVMTSTEKKLERVLMKWVESECSDVTWSTVLKVLKVLQFNELMESTKLFLKREDILIKYLPYSF